MSDGTDVFFVNDDISEEELLAQVHETEKKSDTEAKSNFASNQPAAPKSDRDFDADIYKKWFKTKTKSGFLSLRGWLEAGKVSIDIGEVEGGTSHNTLVWADAIEIAAFLRAVTNGVGEKVYPISYGLDRPEGLIIYGGGKQDGQPISRILKITHWKTGTGDNVKYDPSAFVFKCGHFKAKEAQSGAFIPDMKSPLSSNMIKMTRPEVAVMSYRLDLAINHFASTRNGDIFKSLNGEDR